MSRPEEVTYSVSAISHSGLDNFEPVLIPGLENARVFAHELITEGFFNAHIRAGVFHESHVGLRNECAECKMLPMPYEEQESAQSLANRIHAGQTRKSSGAPYYDAHLVPVAALVKEYGGTPIEIEAALLHDTVEDSGAQWGEVIRRERGDEVLSLVLECTEEGTGHGEKAPWRQRKDSYLAQISHDSAGALLISICDKLQSAEELAENVRTIGDKAYEIFKDGKENQLWFHEQLVTAYQSRLNDLKTQQEVTGLESAFFRFKDAVLYLLSQETHR